MPRTVVKRNTTFFFLLLRYFYYITSSISVTHIYNNKNVLLKDLSNKNKGIHLENGNFRQPRNTDKPHNNRDHIIHQTYKENTTIFLLTNKITASNIDSDTEVI